ncbi:MAG: hypothetical protein KGZ37_00860 [Nitrosarchaeum sp.]|nr:hypothetical protein [Nitrosarchaeum sp.]
MRILWIFIPLISIGIFGMSESFAELEATNQTTEEIIDDIQDTINEIKVLDDLLDEAVKVDISVSQILELKKQVDLLVEDEPLRDNLIDILDLALLHLEKTGDFIIKGDKEQTDNSISTAQNYLAEFIYAGENAQPKSFTLEEALEIQAKRNNITNDTRSYLKNTEFTGELTADDVHCMNKIYDEILTQKVRSPKLQVFCGTPIEKITCNEGLELIFKSKDNSPACVSPKTAEKLVERGWT